MFRSPDASDPRVWPVPTLRQLVETGDGELVEELLCDFESDTASAWP